MHARILLTNGARTLTLYRVHHGVNKKGEVDVYHGWHPNEKGSYHASGQTHSKTRKGDVHNVQLRTPLRELSGAHVLGSIGLLNHPSNFEGEMAESQQYKPSRKKSASDAILVIDSRAIPNDASIQITVGLLEPRNFIALDRLIYRYGETDGILSDTKQFLLDTSVHPWVWAKVDMVSQIALAGRHSEIFGPDSSGE